jgi:hypothetical protein
LGRDIEVEVGDRDAVAVGDERLDDAAADPLRASGDDGNS